MGKATAPDLERYTRQLLFSGMGEAGQRRLLAAKTVVIGCGALGTAIANLLARAGIGEIVIADRDFIELNNLQRQTLFDEEDIRRGLPKAVAAAEKLRRINSTLTITPVVTDVHFANIESLIRGATCVLDGTDNFETRYLINDACVKHQIPWIYGGVIGASGMSMTILPGRTPCLRCLFAEMPAPGTAPTCDTAGVLGPIVGTIAAIECTEALKLITGAGRRNEGLITMDLWENRFTSIAIAERSPDCPACGQGTFAFLAAREGVRTTTLCGHNAVQVSLRSGAALDLTDLAKKLAPLGEVAANEFMLRLKVDGFELTVFPDARAIVQGTTDPAQAKTLYAKYVGV